MSGFLDAPSYSRADVDRKVAAARRLAALVPVPRQAVTPPALHPSPPTITESTSATITSNFASWSAMMSSVTKLGVSLSLNTGSSFAYNSSDGGFSSPMAYGFHLTGDTVEISWRAQVGAGAATGWQIWVDGRPITAGPVGTGLSISAGGFYYLKLTFAQLGSYDIRIYSIYTDLGGMRTPASQSLGPISPRPWTIAAVGDSYGETNASAGTNILQSWGKIMCDQLGAEWVHGCQPGTGYTANGGGGGFGIFEDPRRIAGLVGARPDLVVIYGGVNDRAAATATTSAAIVSYLAALKVALPSTAVIVAGPQPMDYVTTVQTATYAAMNAAARTAASNATNCLGHIDAIGHAVTGAVAADYATGTTYAVGDRVKYAGTMYRCVAPTTASGSPQPLYFEPTSWLSGTGYLGNVGNNGNRDVCLASDNVHPTAQGQLVHGTQLASAVAALIRAIAA